MSLIQLCVISQLYIGMNAGCIKFKYIRRRTHLQAHTQAHTLTYTYIHIHVHIHIPVHIGRHADRQTKREKQISIYFWIKQLQKVGNNNTYMILSWLI